MRAITQIPATFPFQSFPDGTLERGIREQASGSPIVDALVGGAGPSAAQSQKREAQTRGVGVALHPASECPVAVKFKGGTADSSEVILTPGQKVRVGTFDAIEWGLPFGWLGGGTATLLVLHTPEADVAFTSQPGSVVFHRVRTTIVTDFAQPVPANWPGTFPWPNAINLNSKPQGAGPVIPIQPDLVLVRLRQEALAAPADLYLHFQAITPLDERDTPDNVDANVTVVPLTIPTTPAGRPLVWLPAEVARLVSVAGGVNVVDPANAAGLVGVGIEFVRYGRLG
jgi:hypothetical protein